MYLATSASSPSISIYAAESLELVKTLRADSDEADIVPIEFSADGGRIVAGANNQRVYVFDVENESILSALPCHGRPHYVHFNDVGDKVLAWVLGYRDGDGVHVWNLQTEELLFMIPSATYSIAQFAGSGAVLHCKYVSAVKYFTTCSLFDGTTGAAKCEISVKDISRFKEPFVISPGGDTVATVNKDGDISVWNLSVASSLTLTERCVLLRRDAVGVPYPYRFSGLTFSVDGSKIISSTNKGRWIIWDVTSRTVYGSVIAADTDQSPHFPVVLTADYQKLVICYGSLISVYDVQTGERIRDLELQGSYAACSGNGVVLM
jgi:WD40 repeat protein